MAPVGEVGPPGDENGARRRVRARRVTALICVMSDRSATLADLDALENVEPDIGDRRLEKQ